VKKYGLIGKSLSHSFSKQYFDKKFVADNISGASYTLFEIATIEDITAILDTDNLVGLNVTIPYKESVIEYLTQLDEVAAKVGAVNIIKLSQGKITGYNTDVYGFEESLKPLLEEQHNKALILGTGGASKAVTYVLDKLGILYQFVSTKKDSSYLQYDDISSDVLIDYKLIINTTPLGMFPDVNDTLLPNLEGIGNQHFIYDLIYNPSETKLLKEAKHKGAIIKNGLEMLQLQAEKNWEIWNE